ncbi:MAG: hypothetical protein RL209_425 [Pseudomonadota bacterium]
MGPRCKRPCRISAIAQLIHRLYGAAMLNAILSIAMLSAFLLLYGAWKRWRREGVSQQMWLMVAAALVVFANVAIWVVPNDKGQSLATGSVDQR